VAVSRYVYICSHVLNFILKKYFPRGTKEITHRRPTHYGLEVPPNAPGLVVFKTPLV
jgi:hypothetical protein